MRQAAVVVALSAAPSGQRAARPCRPSRPASAMRPTAGATFAASAEFAGIDARTLGTDLPAAAAVPQGSSVKELSADGRRHPLGHADRRFLARVTGPLWSLANSRGG